MGISMFHAKNDAEFFRPVDESNQHHRNSPGIDVPVVIIGGGPAGLFQAHLLSQLGGMCFGGTHMQSDADHTDSEMSHY